MEFSKKSSKESSRNSHKNYDSLKEFIHDSLEEFIQGFLQKEYRRFFLGIPTPPWKMQNFFQHFMQKIIQGLSGLFLFQ